MTDERAVARFCKKMGVDESPEDGVARGLVESPEAARLLLNRRIGALPVLKDERLVGIITETDMIRALIDLEEAKGT